MTAFPARIVPLPAQVSETSLTLPDDLSYDEWVSYGEGFARMAHAAMWWLGDWWAFGNQHYGERAKAAAVSDRAFQTCMDAGWVARRVETSRRREVLPFGYHKEVAALDTTDQEYFLTRWAKTADDNGRPPPRHIIRAEVAAFKRERNRPQFDPPQTPLTALGPFDVLYADPPWRYEQVRTDSRAIENHYPTMSLDEICALQPPALDDAILFLWATSPKLREAMDVIEAWGFNYRTCMVWMKDKIGMGHYVRQRHELLLLAKRGDISTPDTTSRPDSVVEAPRGAHSAKPDVFYELIESMYPGRRYGEIFARQPRPGWASWGNEL
jgi:N6-adenosine-specific RNA methylase IME4